MTDSSELASEPCTFCRAETAYADRDHNFPVFETVIQVGPVAQPIRVCRACVRSAVVRDPRLHPR